MTVTTVVPVWNRRNLLTRLLGKLRAQTEPPAEVIVVDNGSTDGAAEAAEAAGACVIRMGSNAGFAAAVNRGVEACRTALVAVVNTDVEPAPKWLAWLVEAMRDPAVWFAAGKILSASARDRIDGTFDLLCRGGTPWRAGHGRPDGEEFARRRRIALASATATLYRTELFHMVGGFDPGFESYLEDVDFSLRCARRGWSGIYVPEAIAYHQGSATLGRWHPDSVRRMARNQVLLVAKHYPRPLSAADLWAVLVAQGLWGLVALRHGAGLAYLRGKLAGLRLARSVPAPEGDHEWLAKLLHASEKEIRDIQSRTGFDRYWKTYFWLAPGEAD